MGEKLSCIERIFEKAGRKYILGQNARYDELKNETEGLKRTIGQLTSELNQEKAALRGAQIALAEAYEYMKVRKETNPSLEENIRNNNIRINRFDEMFENLAGRLDMQEVKFKKLSRATVEEAPLTREKAMTPQMMPVDNEYDCVDYFDFENHFRGSREAIKSVQKQYIPYFKGRTNVLDLGCGRGEFLELLKECQINAIGVECYTEFAEYCKKKGLNVAEDDALVYLRNQDKVGGIFAGQLIEHLKFNQIVELCELAYQKLEEGAYIIMETPNPMSLAIYTHAFYMDPSHNKPVHPLTMEYFMHKVGFKDVKILFTESSRYPVEIPELKVGGVENLDAFNKSMKEVSETLFGSQDYAIIGRR